MRAFISVTVSVGLVTCLLLGGCNATYTLKASQLNQQGQIYFQYGEYDQARQVFKESVDIDFENSATHYWLGRCYQAKADPHSAIEEYRLAVRFSPALEIAQIALITTLHQVGRLDESIVATKSYMKYKTGRAGELVLLAQDFIRRQMDNQAIITFMRAQELEPANPLPSVALADYYLARGEKEKERETIMMAVAIEPFYPGLARRAGQLGIKIESPRPQPFPPRTPLQRALDAQLYGRIDK